MSRDVLVLLFGILNVKSSMANDAVGANGAIDTIALEHEGRNLDSTYTPKPKMVAEEVIPGSEFFHNDANKFKSEDEIVQSKAAIYSGPCSSNAPFEFKVGGRVGRGVIGVGAPSTSVITSLDVMDDSKGKGKLIVDEKTIPNFFAGIGSDDSSASKSESFVGMSFQYRRMRNVKGTTLRVSCANQAEPVDIIVFAEDKKSKTIKASITQEKNQRIVAVLGDDASMVKGELRAESLRRQGKGRDNVSVQSGPTYVSSQEAGSITLLQEAGQDVAAQSDDEQLILVQLFVEDAENGMLIPKTLPISSRMSGSKPRRLKESTITVKDTFIDENGDVVFQFAQLGEDEKETYLLHARFGIVNKCATNSQSVEHIVDMRAMLTGKKPTMIVHGGWFRRALADEQQKPNLRSNGSSCHDWEPILVDAFVQNPEDRYTTIGRLESSVHTRVMKGDGNHSGALRRLSSAEIDSRRNLLKALPSSAEIEVNDDMRKGRRPVERNMDGNSTGRKLAESSKKILLHGYCSGSGVFNAGHYSNTAEFKDLNRNRSNAQFAQLIDQFTYDEGIGSCGIIAHSQGGLAALHLYTYFFSCLDNASNGGSRLIQSVGSPYHGSPLAGNLALIGNAFGQGCGKNDSISTWGAQNWLKNIPNWARSSVYYKTTSVKSDGKWWTWDACHRATGLILSDPDDGATEKHRGQLPGGNNLGHSTGLCHTGDMNNDSQTKDYSLNSNMNSNARF